MRYILSCLNDLGKYLLEPISGISNLETQHEYFHENWTANSLHSYLSIIMSNKDIILLQYNICLVYRYWQDIVLRVSFICRTFQQGIP